MNHYDPLDIDSQDKVRAVRATREQLADQADIDDVRWLMSSKRGRRILWRTLERGEVFKLSFNTNSMSMAFAEGRKNEGLRTLALIHTASPDLYATMMKESRE